MRGRPWTEAEISRLRALYPDMRGADVARELGRPLKTVYAKAKALGLGKSDAFKASDLSGRVQRGKQLPAMQATQFKKGVLPWNTGTHFVAGGRSAETRFKPGQKGANWVPIGSLRVNGDGYLDRKVADEGRGPRDWVAVHRLVWIEACGPVPEGHVVVFKPGRRTAVLDLITLDALELITRSELMRRNTLHRLPKEVAQLFQLKGAITRQVNRLAKENQ